MRGQGRLNEDAVEPRISVEPIEQGEEFSLRGGLWENVSLGIKTETLARLLFHADVNPRRWILPDPDKHKSRPGATGFQDCDALRGFRVELFRDGATVDEIRRH